MGPTLVTGANGQIAVQLFARLAQRKISARALVRSQRAAAVLAELPESYRPEIRIADPRDAAAVVEAASGCRSLVHLVGILKESASARYRDAHEATCSALVEAAADLDLERIVYLSIFGSTPDSGNACLASKGRAEDILRAGPTPVTVLRVPMVVGPGDPASRALRGQAQARWLPLIGGGVSVQQPLDIRDLMNAILASLECDSRDSYFFDLGGAESLQHRDLVARAARLFGNEIGGRVIPIPVWLIRTIAYVLERFQKSPPITPAMLGVLEQDDRIENGPALDTLGLELRTLDETLKRYIGPEVPAP
jgi:uncharacterized protein YbjT (DUF2867 family)